VQWTNEQQAAIDTRGCDLLVAAAAGSGKTAVLVERIVKMITNTSNPIDVDALLVVTFTNAAAAEMRERLGEAISRKLEEEPRNTHLQKQLTLLNRASISTIHSFCLDVIRNHFHLLDLDPSFRIADEAEMLLLKNDLIEALFEEFYEREDEGFHALVESYGGKKEDSNLQDMILRIYDFIQSNPWPKEWLKEQVDIFNPERNEDFDATLWADMIKGQIRTEAQGLLEIADYALSLCYEPNGPEKYIEAIEDDIRILKKIIALSEGSIGDLYSYIQQITFSTLGRCGKNTDPNLKEEVNNLRKIVKEGVQKGFQEKIFFKSPEAMMEDVHKVFPILKALERVIHEFSDRFQSAKKEMGVIDFNDIEHYCLKILLDEKSTPQNIVPSLTALDLREKYKEILIDEYQDSNLVQETILGVISKKDTAYPNRFMVGDVKQSIYRFRLAKPDLFIEKYNSFSDQGEGKAQRIDLFQNFRSRENILHGVNFIFRQLMTPTLGEIEYDEKAALNPGANYPEAEHLNMGGPIEIHMIESESANDGSEEARGEEKQVGEELEELTNIELEAKIVTQRIQQLLSDEESFFVYDKKLGDYRRVEYRDIVILLRTTSQWSNIFMEELSRGGIPAYADVSSGYFDAVEVKTILSLLQIIDNPRQDIPLITVLRSPIVALNADELVEIRTVFSQGDFYESLLKYIDSSLEETQLTRKIRDFLEKLKRWRSEAAHISIDELLWMLYTETNYYNYLGAMPGGAQRQANLRILRDRAASYESTSFKGLFNFIRFIERMQRKQGDMGAAKIVGENENIVRIMSIHKSKGLEFPVVFVSGLGKQFNLQDLHQPVLLHQDLGLGPDYIDYERRIVYETAPKLAVKSKIMVETLSEEMRILYVAFTRAKEKLILTGTIKNIEAQARKWARQVSAKKEALSPYILTKAKTYLEWIGLSLVRHRDAETIRNWAGCLKAPEEVFYEDPSQWRIYSWTKEDITLRDENKAKEKERILEELLNWDTSIAYSPHREEIFNRLSWKYPYESSTALSVMVSVSELKKQHEKDMLEEQSTSLFKETGLSRPHFIEESKGLNATEKGILMHFVMKHLNLDEAKDYTDIEHQLLKMELKGLLSEEERKAIFIKDLLHFSRSQLAGRMRAALKVRKEVSFVLSLNAREIYKEIQCDEEVFVRGIIDCYFEEEDGIVLVDYKTDAIFDKENPEREIDQLMKKYEVQINLYARAIEELTGKRVKEKSLYLFSIGKAVSY
jgi:ATP-dependent helicase/nuclease subunit A